MTCRVLQTARDIREPNADVVAARYGSGRARLALCDGATVSYDAAGWARLVAERFVRSPRLDARWLRGAIEVYENGCDRDALTWQQQAGFDQGSHSTLLGLELDRGRRMARLVAVGDSHAFLVRRRRVRRFFPYHSQEEFGPRPDLLSTRRELIDRTRKPGFVRRQIWRVLPEDLLLLASDALAQWILSHCQGPDRAAGLLHSLANEAAFERYIAGERSGGRMHVDDTTLVVVEVR